MTESDMEFLLWNHPEKFFDERLKQFKRQGSWPIGRSDVIFEDAAGGLVIVEVKLNRLPRSAVFQIDEYRSAAEIQFPDKPLRLVLVANSVPEERKLMAARHGIECRAISQQRFQEVGSEVGFAFHSEKHKQVQQPLVSPPRSRVVSARKLRKGSASKRREVTDGAGSIPCPQVPDSAWYGLSGLYREAVAKSAEASDNFHFAGFLAAAGVGLGGSVYANVNAPEPVYPNLFVALVERGSHVRQATRLAARLIEEAAPDARRLHSLDSREGLILAVSKIQTSQNSRGVGAILLLNGRARFLIEGNYKGGRKTMQFLGELYECPPSLEVRTLHNPVVVDPAPCISVLTSSEDYSSWTRRLKVSDTERGLGDRMILVGGQPKPPNARPVQPPEGLWKSLVASLQEIFEFWRAKGSTGLRLTESAAELWSSSRALLDDRMTGDPVFDLLASRYGDYILKCGLIFAALDRSGVIDEHHLQAGVAFAEFLFQSLRYLVGLPLETREEEGIGPSVKDENAIIAYVRGQGGQVQHVKARRRFDNIDMETWEGYMHSIVADTEHTERPLKWVELPGRRNRKIRYLATNE